MARKTMAERREAIDTAFRAAFGRMDSAKISHNAIEHYYAICEIIAIYGRDVQASTHLHPRQEEWIRIRDELRPAFENALRDKAWDETLDKLDKLVTKYSADAMSLCRRMTAAIEHGYSLADCFKWENESVTNAARADAYTALRHFVEKCIAQGCTAADGFANLAEFIRGEYHSRNRYTTLNSGNLMTCIVNEAERVAWARAYEDINNMHRNTAFRL